MKKMKKIISVLLCILIVFSLSACTAEKGLDAKLIFPIDNDPKFLDPQIISDVGAINIILNCFEGLVTRSVNGEIIPGMAERWDVSADGKTYVFYLRENSRWRVTSAAKKVLGGDNIQLSVVHFLCIGDCIKLIRSRTLCFGAEGSS